MKEFLHKMLEMEGPAGRRYGFFVLVMILSSLSLFLMEFFSELSPYFFVIEDFEIFFTIFFSLEFLLKIIFADKKLRFLFSYEGISDLFSILPFYINIFFVSPVPFFQFLKLLRILKIGEFHHKLDRVELVPLLHLDDDEEIEYIIFRHPVYILVLMPVPILFSWISWMVLSLFHLEVFSILIALFFLLFSVLFTYKVWLDFVFDMLAVTSKRIVVQNRHVIGKDIDYLRFEAITNVKYEYAGMVGYLLGYGNLIIETQATTKGYFKFNFIRKYREGAEAIKKKLV